MIETLLLATWCPDEALGEASTPEHRSFQVEELAKIVAQLDRYALKFAGVTVNGERRVLIEASVVDDPGAWMSTQGSSPWEIIDDGGCDYWSIQYDPASDRCIEFESHGYA
jgi:hypothetical protein